MGVGWCGFSVLGVLGWIVGFCGFIVSVWFVAAAGLCGLCPWVGRAYALAAGCWGWVRGEYLVSRLGMRDLVGFGGLRLFGWIVVCGRLLWGYLFVGDCVSAFGFLICLAVCVFCGVGII